MYALRSTASPATMVASVPRLLEGRRQNVNRMRLLPITAVLLMIFSNAAANADEAVTAREHYRRGTNAFNLGHYIDAVKEYEAAYQAKEDPALLFNIAQAYRLAGENDAAVRVYKSFLHQMPDSAQRGEVEKRNAEL